MGKEHGITQLYVLGGDGTMRGSMRLVQELASLDHECACVSVPSTVDNDIPLVDQTFGFNTAMCEAAKCIEAAYVEATCNANCIGMVKLSGRKSGFIAMNATLAARLVDICL